MARMAGEIFHQTMTEREKPIVPGFNNEDQMQAVNYRRIDEYGRNVAPGRVPVENIPRNRYNEEKPSVDVWTAPQKKAYSGSPGQQVAAVPAGLLPKIFIKEAAGGTPTADGTLYKGQPDPFQENNKIRPSDSDDQFMDVMRSGFV